jgi:hypothetical protein
MRDSRQPVTTWAEDDIVGIRYQATASEDMEDLANVVKISKNVLIVCSYGL